MAAKNTKHGRPTADQLREANEKLIKQLSDRRLMEGVLRENSQVFRAILDTLPVAVSLAEDRKLTWANPAFMKIHGFESPDDYIGQSTEILFASQDEFERAVHVVYSDLEIGNSAEISVKQKRKDGSIFDARLRSAFFSTADSAKRIVVCCTTDMSAQIEVEGELRRSDERYRTSLEQSFDGALIVKGSKILYGNSRFSEMIGYPKEELERMDYLELLHPDYRELVTEKTAARMRGEKVPGYYEVTLLRKDGASLEVELNTRVVEMQGEACLQAWIRDVSERKKDEESAKQSEERYRALVEQAFDGIMIHDGKKIVFANTRLCEMLGYQKEELEGIDHWMTLHPDYREKVIERAAARARGENVPGHYEVKQLCKDGSSFDSEIRSQAIQAHDVRLVHVWIKDISELKKAEEEARKSQERYRTLVEESFDGVLVHDGKKVQFANSRLCEMLGYRKEELEGMDVELTPHPDDRHLVKKRIIARMNGEDVPSLYEFKLQRKDGAALEVETNARAVVLEGRTVLQSWIRDISERKQAEEALRRSEANYRAIFDSMNDAIFVHDIETGTVIDVNRKMCEMYGYTREEAIRLVAGETSFGNDKHSRELALQRIAMAARGEPQLFEWQAKAKDGRLFWVEVNLRKAILNDKPYVLAVVRDITDRKRAEAERENERQKFRTLVDDAPFGIVMIRKDSTYEYVNPKFTEIFGYDLNDIPDGKHWLEKSWPDPEYRRKTVEAWVADVADMKQGVVKVRTFAVTSADGIEKMITLRSAQLHTGEFILTCEDVTQQVRGEQERENLRHQLLHAQKMEALGTLVGGIAHDFNNLLTIILGYSELLLLEKGEDDPGKADLQKIIDAGSSGAALVQRMLTFSEQSESVLGPLNLNHEIENMKELLSRTIPKMISLELETAEDLALVDGDAGQIQQIILNLALNAMDAMPNGGKLLIQTSNLTLEEQSGKSHSVVKPGNYVLLSVSDTGRGMDPEIMQRMYDPFFTTKNRDFVKGTGLGLAIVHGIVMAHSGEIVCSSEPGEGTRFELYFPAVPDSKLIRDEQHDDSITAVSSIQGDETILLVDDEEMVRDLGTRILKRAGYEVLTARNGKEALEVYSKEAEKIALVILDLIMPEMGGERCLEELLRINPKAKIIVSTGYASNDETTRIRIEALASSFVAKPFTLSNMLKTVRETLDRQ